MDGRNTNTSSVAVIENAIRLNGGAIRTRGTEINADLRYARSFGPPAISQVIKNITITSTPRVPTEKHGSIPTYGPGEIVQFTVHLSQPIVVSGDVVIKVTTPGNRGNAAEYSSGNGSEKLVFEWIVPDDDENLSTQTNDLAQPHERRASDWIRDFQAHQRHGSQSQAREIRIQPMGTGNSAGDHWRNDQRRNRHHRIRWSSRHGLRAPAIGL